MILFQIGDAHVGIEEVRHLVFKDTDGFVAYVRFGHEEAYPCWIQV